MKKLLTVAILFSAINISNAQELLSKKGTPVLPEAKDWSIGFQADPLLKYFGNFFNKDNNNNTILESQVPLTLVGLYMKDDHTAYRLKLRIGLGAKSTDNFVDDDNYQAALPKAKTTDTWKATSTNLAVGFGIQKSRGKGRLRGIYGIEATLGFNSSTDSYTYGNPFKSDKSDPTSTSDWTQKDTTGNYISISATSRTSKVNNPNQFSLLLNGFIGAEYFFAPKLSLSAEYGYGVNLITDGERETFTVSADGASGKETSVRNAKSSQLSLDVIDAGAITLHLYF
ncbi:hypothetical protein BH11BAC1_BH11BAC1_22830 [soil metagenome]